MSYNILDFKSIFYQLLTRYHTVINCLVLQAFFSFVRWPYSMKLLWAPIVDALYVHSIGRRKSWLIPIQYVTGVLTTFFFVE